MKSSIIGVWGLSPTSRNRRFWLRAEYAELLAMKKAAYPEYYRAKDEYRELLTYQANLAGLFGIENVRSAPQREYQQEEK